MMSNSSNLNNFFRSQRQKRTSVFVLTFTTVPEGAFFCARCYRLRMRVPTSAFQTVSLTTAAINGDVFGRHFCVKSLNHLNGFHVGKVNRAVVCDQIIRPDRRAGHRLRLRLTDGPLTLWASRHGLLTWCVRATVRPD